MTLYMRWLPKERAFADMAKAMVGAIGVLRQTDRHGQCLIDFYPENSDVREMTYWCRPQDLELVKERDYYAQRAAEALGIDAKTDEET
jgi:hypothetical protein